MCLILLIGPFTQQEIQLRAAGRYGRKRFAHAKTAVRSLVTHVAGMRT